ncbi:MAG TPA: hypothetical protein VFC29_23160 [Candidatus Limnocylindrales bacterium]|nr:hypothetical protein [Candidatus Limnocylindrales bacterium]
MQDNPFDQWRSLTALYSEMSDGELLAERGLYWKLYQLQYKDQETGIRDQGSGISRQPSAIPG